MWWYVIQVAPRSKQIYEEKEIIEIVEFVSPNNQGPASTHGTEVAMLVDNQFDHEDDQNHDQFGSTHDTSNLEEDDDLDSPYETNEARISEKQVDWHLVNNDEISGELDIFIDIFAQQGLQANDDHE